MTPTLHRRFAAVAGTAVGLVLLVASCGEDRAAEPANGSGGRETAALPPPGSDETPPDKLALLVGIDEYAHGTSSSFPELSGCVNDVEAVHRLLVTRFDFEPGNVKVLTDAQATHENIVRAFHEWLILRSGPETEALFWYSGHGSRIPDASGAPSAELDGLESSFVAHDSRADDLDGAYDISDDELYSLVAALTDRTSRVTLVTDACHSGGGVRSGGPMPVARAIGLGSQPLDHGRIEAFWPPSVPLLEDDQRTRTGAAGYVHIAACAPRQRALEIPTMDDDGNTVVHGALTWYLAQVLEEAQPGTSYRRLADDTAIRLACRLPGQTVWYEGLLERELFGSRFEEQPPGFPARERKDGELVVQAGTIHGLRRGSRIALLDGRDGTELGEAEVITARSQVSLAHWTSQTAVAVEAVASGDEAQPRALRAVELTRPAGQDPLRVHVTDAELASLLEGSEWLELAEPSDAEYFLSLEPGEPYPRLVAADGTSLWSRVDTSRAVADSKTLRREVDADLREELRYRSLVRLAATPGLLELEAEFVEPTEKELLDNTSRTAGVVRHESADGSQAAGLEFRGTGGYDPTINPDQRRLATLRVVNTNEAPVYVSVFSVAEDRSRHPIWPNGGRREEPLEPGASLRVHLLVVANRNWSAERPMRDRYLVLATREFADLSAYERATTLRSASVESTAMPPEIAAAMQGTLTRGSRRIEVQGADWGVTTVDLLVDKP